MLSASPSAEANTRTADYAVERSLKEIPGFDLRRLGEWSAEDVSRTHVPLGRDVLEECGFVSLTRWELRERSSGRRAFLDVAETLHLTVGFSLFSLWNGELHDGEEERLELPVENSYRSGSLLLWQGPLVLHLRYDGENGDARAFLTESAAALFRHLEFENAFPVTIVQLPEEGLRRESVRFYVGENSLRQNPRFPHWLIPTLGFEDQIEVGYASYGPDAHPLFLVGYPTPSLAAEYYLRIQNAMESFFSPEGVFTKRAGVLIPIFIGPEKQALEVLNKVEYAAEIRWIYDKHGEPDPGLEEARGFLVTLAGYIVSSLLLIFLTLGLGVIIGLIRYQLLENYPDVFRRKEPMTRLDLRKS